MKKATLILGALALVLGLSQCRKPNAPAINVGNGETIVQQITVGATCNGGNSKMSGTTAGNALNLTWDEGDKMNADRMDVLEETKTLTLSEGAGTASGKFTGTIEGVAGTTKLAFLYSTPNAQIGLSLGVLTINDAQFLNQNGKLEKTEDSKASDKNSILDRLILFADNIPFINSSAAEYSVDLKVPYAILKLDLSAFGTTAGTTVTVKADGSVVASVTGVTNAANNPYYVAMPAAASRKYTFSGNSKTGKATWALAANTFYTKSGSSTGEAIVVAPEFSVSATKTVEFSKGNLYYDGKNWHFEANQWDYANTWNVKHVGLFFWSNTTDWKQSGKQPYAASYSYNTRTTTDKFFTEDSGFIVDGEKGWGTLTSDEWNYLLSNRPNATKLRGLKTLTDVKVYGLVILPDGSSTTSLSSIKTAAGLAAAGAVFLPAAGFRINNEMKDVGSNGCYYSSTPHKSSESDAWYMYFKDGNVTMTNFFRSRGLCVRLVR